MDDFQEGFFLQETQIKKDVEGTLRVLTAIIAECECEILAAAKAGDWFMLKPLNRQRSTFQFVKDWVEEIGD